MRLCPAMLAVLCCLTASPVAAQTAAPPDPVETAPPKPEGKPPDEQEQSKAWWERLQFYGDFRGRYDGAYQAGSETRHRERFRFRLGVKTAIAEGLDFNLRVASGEAADVTSTNQSLTEFLNRKPVNIDQVSLAYTPTSLEVLTVGFGKYAYPVKRTQMVWDDDVNWEGTYEQFSFTAGAPFTFRVVGVQSPINEIGAGEDAFMFGEYVQAGIEIGRHRVHLSVADYAFINPDQIAVALDERAFLRSQSTNTLRRNPSGRVVGFESGFNLVDAIAHVTVDSGRPHYPIAALANLVANTRAADEDKGLWLVGTYGQATMPKTYAASYTFARIERDAVLSAFNFSDMEPATNVVMNMLTFSYMPRSRVNLDAIAILTKRIDVSGGERNPILKRFQIDARVSF